jgi:hypothetical protein
VIDDLVLQANGGIMPTATDVDAGWTERVTNGRFAG